MLQQRYCQSNVIIDSFGYLALFVIRVIFPEASLPSLSVLASVRNSEVPAIKDLTVL